MIESGVHLVQIEVTDYLGPVGPDAVRAIDVPFEIPPDGEIEIGSISDTASLSMPSGKYLLRCEFFGSEGDTGERVSITFSRKDERRFKLVRVDENLSPEGELLLAAQAAIG